MATVNCGFPEKDSLYKFGPTLWVQVGFDTAFHPNSRSLPNLPITPWPALVDTGATDCSIDSVLATNLLLPIFDRVQVSGVGGLVPVNQHLAQVYIPSLNWTIYGSFSGVHLAAGGQPHRVLIGRSLLRDFRMEYDGRTGHVMLTR
jgi:hypothetical protein